MYTSVMINDKNTNIFINHSVIFFIFLFIYRIVRRDDTNKLIQRYPSGWDMWLYYKCCRTYHISFCQRHQSASPDIWCYGRYVNYLVCPDDLYWMGRGEQPPLPHQQSMSSQASQLDSQLSYCYYCIQTAAHQNIQGGLTS